MALKLRIVQTYQILTIDDEVFIASLFSILLAVLMRMLIFAEVQLLKLIDARSTLICWLNFPFSMLNKFQENQRICKLTLLCENLWHAQIVRNSNRQHSKTSTMQSSHFRIWNSIDVFIHIALCFSNAFLHKKSMIWFHWYLSIETRLKVNYWDIYKKGPMSRIKNLRNC